MKSWIILIVAAVGLTAAASVAVPLMTNTSSAGKPGIPAPSAAPEGPAPSVEVDGELTYKFGVMAQETEGKHGWVFKNAGPGILELRNLGSDCSCTVPQIGDPHKPGAKSQQVVLPVKPGSSEPVELTWQTRTNNGDYRKTARIGTNDPQEPADHPGDRGQGLPRRDRDAQRRGRRLQYGQQRRGFGPACWGDVARSARPQDHRADQLQPRPGPGHLAADDARAGRAGQGRGRAGGRVHAQGGLQARLVQRDRPDRDRPPAQAQVEHQGDGQGHRPGPPGPREGFPPRHQLQLGRIDGHRRRRPGASRG